MTRFAILLFSFFLIHHHHHRVTADDVSAEEKQALLTFIQKVPHHRDYSWKESEPVCVPPKEGDDDQKKGNNWKGVQCIGINSVTHLSMPAASLVGEIPPGTIGKLVNLRVLSLHTNALNGPIPHDFSNLKLTHLYLHNNKISGQLPNMKSDELEKIDVSNNKFTGSIPSNLSKFPKSVFDRNINLCGDPLPPCKNGTVVSPPPQPTDSKADDTTKKSTEKGLIVGVSIGSGVILLIFLCCLRKRITKQSKQPPELPVQKFQASASKAGGGKSSEGDRNKLVFLDEGVYSFDMEDLYRASTEVLGKGSFGTSLKTVMDGGTTTVVVKRLKDVVVTKKEFESRMEVLGKMKNEYLIPLRAYYYSKHEKLLVHDYMSAGSLFAHLHNGSRGVGLTRLDWKQRMRIALGAARGVEYLHVVGKVVHGNIKSSNILIRQETNKDAFVSDYGLNTLFNTLSSQNHRVTGYQAPEVLKTREVTFESDVYSFGVLLLELLTGKDPNQTSMDREGIEFPMWVQSITHEESKAEVLDVELRRHQDIEEKMVRLLQIAKDCVLIEPNRRPTMHKVARMMEDMNRVEMDDWLRQSSDDHSKLFDDTPSTETRDTPSTITP